MKICVITKSVITPENFHLNRTHLLSKSITEQGVDLVVFQLYQTYFDSLPSNRVIIDGVQYHFFSKKKRHRNIILRKVVDFIVYFKILLSIGLNTQKSKINILTGAAFDFRIFIPFISLFNSSKLVLELNEYPFVGQNTFISAIKEWIYFKIIVKLYDGFILISTNLEIKFSKHKRKSSPIIKVPIIGVATNKNSTYKNPISERYIIHAGSLYEEKDGIIGMIKAFDYAKSNLSFPLKYVFTGTLTDSSYHKKIKNLIDELHLKNDIVFTGYLSREDFDAYLSNASLAIINKADNKQNAYCFATKTVEYINFRIPILMTHVGEAMSFFDDQKNAFIVSPNDTEQMGLKIILALESSNIDSILDSASKLIQNDFNYSKQGDLLVDFINDMIQHTIKKAK